MLRRKRLSLAPDSLADLREISAEELQGTRVARALELQQKTEERQNEMVWSKFSCLIYSTQATQFHSVPQVMSSNRFSKIDLCKESNFD